MAEGTANFVTRGKGQQIDLSPYLYSYDPDFPDDKVYFIKWGGDGGGIEIRYFHKYFHNFNFESYWVFSNSPRVWNFAGIAGEWKTLAMGSNTL